MTTDTLPSRNPWRRTAARVLVGIVGIALLLAVGLWLGGRWYLSLSVADYEGERQVAGLHHPVEITFDRMGVPQVWAETDADMYLALGWLHASERLFQMESARRTASGTLSEVFGARAFQTDLRQRQIGFRHLAEAAYADLDSRTRSLLEAYATGINQRIELARVLPPEFVFFRFRPRPWTVLDVVTVFVYQSWYPTQLSDRSGPNARLVEDLGEEAAGLLEGHRPWSLPSVPETFLQGLANADAFPHRMTTATNAWAIAPERGASGHALHAADPHLAVNSIPGFWYVVGLHSAEGTEAVGITLPGVPVVAMGHNGTVAWSFSVAPLVLVDHFTETFHPRDSVLVRTPDGYAPLDVRFEEIQVAGEDAPRRVPIHHTPRGVLLEREGTTGTSMHWSGFDLVGADGISAGLRIPTVRDFETFRRTVSLLSSFSVNWIYSDRSGNIGYQLGPAVPIRTYSPFRRPDAADPEARLEGYFDFDLTPWALNPERGWLATTNNPPAPPDWPIDIPGNFNTLRMHRVGAWMESQETFSRSDMERMQLDVVSEQALRQRDLMAAGAERLADQDLADRLRAWDGRMAPDDSLATVFAYWWHHLTRHLFEDELGARWPDASNLRQSVLLANRTDLIDDRRTPEVETAPDISARALADALKPARGRTLGEVQTLTMRHPLSEAPLLNRWLRLDRGPFPRGGQMESLNLSASAYRPATDDFDVRVAPSMRYVMDWENVDAFTIEIPLGQSGNPFSPHYDDFLDLNRRGERWAVPFSREAVEERAVHRLRLVASG